MFPATSKTITGADGLGGCFADRREAEIYDILCIIVEKIKPIDLFSLIEISKSKCSMNSCRYSARTVLCVDT